MGDTLPHFILAGKISELSQWTEHAANIGILWCYEHERLGRNLCSSSCIRGGGCAIAAGPVLLMVFPADNISTFDDRDYEGMLSIIPSKRLEIADVDAVRALVFRFFSEFHDSSIVCFESSLSSEGQIEWKPFASCCPGPELDNPSDRAQDTTH